MDRMLCRNAWTLSTRPPATWWFWHVDGLSREELAERFDMPVNTIKTRLHRGFPLSSLAWTANDERRTLPQSG